MIMMDCEIQYNYSKLAHENKLHLYSNQKLKR